MKTGVEGATHLARSFKEDWKKKGLRLGLTVEMNMSSGRGGGGYHLGSSSRFNFEFEKLWWQEGEGKSEVCLWRSLQDQLRHSVDVQAARGDGFEQ